MQMKFMLRPLKKLPVYAVSHISRFRMNKRPGLKAVSRFIKKGNVAITRQFASTNEVSKAASLDHRKSNCETLGNGNARKVKKPLYPVYPEPNRLGVKKSLIDMGSSNMAVGHSALRLVRYYSQAFGKYQHLYPKQNHPDVAFSLHAAGLAYLTLGNGGAAVNCCKRGLKMIKSLYPEQDHLFIAESLGALGFAYEAFEDINKELSYKEQALKMLQRLYPEQDLPDVATLLESMSISYETLGDDSKATDYSTQASEMRERLHSQQNDLGVVAPILNSTPSASRSSSTFFQKPSPTRAHHDVQSDATSLPQRPNTSSQSPSYR